MSNIFCYDIQDDNDSCYLWDEILNRLLFQFYKKIAFKVDPEKAHDISLSFLEFIYKSFLGKIFHKRLVKNGIKQFDVLFDNPVGLAAGFDKNAD